MTSPATQKQYASILNRLKAEELFPLLQKQPKLIVSWIGASASKSGSIDTQNSYVNAILWHLRKEFPTADVSAYVEESKRLQLLRQEKAKKQTLPAGKMENLLTWPEVLALKEKAKSDLVDEDYLLYLLYTEMPPLRADFANLRIYTRDSAKLTGNYLLTGNKRYRLVLNEFKTAKTFGKQVLELPEAVVAHLRVMWAKEPESKVPDAILEMTENALSKRVSSLFEKLSGKSMSINLLRHSYIKQFLSVPRTIVEKEAVAKRMLHSKVLQEQYDVLPVAPLQSEEVAPSEEEHSLEFLA